MINSFDLIYQIKKDGLVLTLSSSEVIKVKGKSASIYRWLIFIQTHKSAIIEVL